MSFSSARPLLPAEAPVWLAASLGVLVELVRPWTRYDRSVVALLLVGTRSRVVTGATMPTGEQAPDRAAGCELRGILDALLARAAVVPGRPEQLWPVLIRVRAGSGVTQASDRAWQALTNRECSAAGLGVPLAAVLSPTRRFAVGRDEQALPALELVWHTGRSRPRLRLERPLLPGGSP